MIFIRFILLLLSISFCNSLLAQQNNFQYYSVAEGLAQSQIYAVEEDRNGYLWLGTQGGGLNRFDGQNFEVFTAKDQLINNYIDAIYEDGANLYIGARNGMSVFDGRRFETFFVKKEEGIGVTAFQNYHDKILVGTYKGVYLFDGTSFEYSANYSTRRKSRVFCFYVDSKDRLWIGTKNGALLFDGKDKKLFNSANDFTSGEVTAITEDEDGHIWFATYNGAFSYDGQSFSSFNIDTGLSSNFLNDVLVDQSGNVWLASQNAGVTIWNPVDSTFNVVDAETGLCNNNVRSITQDSWGNLWFATSGGGLCKYAGQQFSHLNISSRPADNLVYSILQDTSQTLWMAAADDGIVRLDSSGFTRFGAAEGFVNSKSKAMLCDSKGRLWFGSNNQGLAYYNGKAFEFLNYKNYELGRMTKDIEEDKNGNIWVASSSQGVFKIKPGDSLVQVQRISIDSVYALDSLIVRKDTSLIDSLIFTYQATKIPEIAFNVNTLHFDRMGRLWFGSRLRGLGVYTSEGLKLYNKNTGLPSNDIRCVTEDEFGHLWIGTAGYGIARLSVYGDSLDIRIFNEQDGLSSSNIYLMKFDKDGALWVGCGRGVDRVEMDESQIIRSVKSYGKTDGFLGVEACQNAVLEDQSGNLWFGTIDGVTKFTPGAKNENTIAPKLQMTGVDLFFEPFEQTKYSDWISSEYILSDKLELPHHQNHISFEFQGVNLANPEKVTYQWQLVGSDQDWSKQSTRNNVTYSSLAPNKYTFKVRAFNEDGVANNPPLQMSFVIKSPIWQRWWFIATGILLIAALVLGIFKWRINQIRKRSAAAQEKLKLENKLLQLEQKALQLQMNPHFIFNALNTVQSLFLSNQQSDARNLISKFAKLMRTTLENSRTSEISLQQEIDLLQHYLAIEQISRPDKFDFIIKVDDQIDSEEVQIPSMLIQPFVENAILHGIVPLKKQGNIMVDFKKQGKQLLCTIKDNGIGREASTKLNAQNARKHKSVALEVTKERLLFLNQNKEQKPLIISDLKNDDGSAAGTKVLIKLPLKEW